MTSNIRVVSPFKLVWLDLCFGTYKICFVNKAPLTDKSPNDGGYNNVTISGASHNIKRAKDAINEVVRRVLEFEDKDRDR